jgi:hypothetical protein
MTVQRRSLIQIFLRFDYKSFIPIDALRSKYSAQNLQAPPSLSLMSHIIFEPAVRSSLEQTLKSIAADCTPFELTFSSPYCRALGQPLQLLSPKSASWKRPLERRHDVLYGATADGNGIQELQGLRQKLYASTAHLKRLWKTEDHVGKVLTTVEYYQTLGTHFEPQSVLPYVTIAGKVWGGAERAQMIVDELKAQQEGPIELVADGLILRSPAAPEASEWTNI